MFTPVGNYDQIGDSVVKLYLADNISPAHEIIIQAFNTEYQGEIELVPINLPFSKFSTNERKELLARTLRSQSNRIDLFTVDLIWVPRFARWSQPLDSVFTSDERDRILEPALYSCYFNDRLYAIPLYFDVSLMYYRKDIVARLTDSEGVIERLERSMTWEEMIELCRQFPSHHGYHFLFPANNFEGLVCCFLAGLESQGASIFSGDSIQLCTKEAERSLQILIDLVNKYQLTPSLVTKCNEYQCYLKANQEDAIFFLGWPGLKKYFEGFIGHPERAENLGIAALPHLDGGVPAHVYGGWNLMVSKHTDYFDAAIQFIRFVQRPENQKILYSLCGYLPVIKEVYTDSAFVAEEPDLAYYQYLLRMGFHRPYLTDYTKISDYISYYLNLAIKGEMSATNALTNATKSINSDKIISNY